ncbi:HAD hydrolase-like protein [Candidatus Kaiserbacteria bacterium]|nr:HAD hydrolase-like protein [Candidatus Kaiserbacteria bacterium]
MQKERTFVLFDFDGVIADSYHQLFQVAHAMHPHFTEEFYRTIWDENIYDAWKSLECTDTCRRGEGEFFKEFDLLKHTIRLFPGADSMIRMLAGEHTLAIISSGISIDVMAHLEKGGIAACFSDVFGKDVHLSKVEKINMILHRYKIQARDCVFVTDTLGDIREAASSGVEAIAVSWGFQPRERLERGNPFQIVDRPEDLVHAVGAYFAEKRSYVSARE